MSDRPESTPASQIPFNRPFVGQEEWAAVQEALSQQVLHGDGPIGRRVEDVLRRMLGVRHAFLTTSCTHALEAAMLAIDLRPGDEVIVPSFTFVSTVNPVVLRGATPVFADIEPRTLNLDPDDVEGRVTRKTKVIIPVHYAGVSCDMDAFERIARNHELLLVEDAAQGIDASFRGRALGSIGDVGCLSFHGTKNVICGEGGAILTSDPEFARRIELIREKGTNRSALIRGEADRYTWMSLGSSFVQSEILSAVLEAQLRKRSEIKRRRGEMWARYFDALAHFAEKGLIQLPVIPEGAEPNFHIFWFLVNDEVTRDRMLEGLKESGVLATSHYVPLHSSPFGRSLTSDPQPLPQTESCSRRLIRLPLWPGLEEGADDLLERICGVMQAEFGNGPPPRSRGVPGSDAWLEGEEPPVASSLPGPMTLPRQPVGLDLTVVIPTYNSRAYIEEALDSVRRQTSPPRRIHVVDDGSSDGTSGVVENWAHSHPDVEVRVSVQENQGPGSARNRAIEAADTKWVALLDADDAWEPWHLEWAGEALELEPETDLYFSDELFIDSSGTPLGGTMLGDSLIHEVPTEPVGERFRVMARSPFRWLIFGNFIPPSTAVFRKSAAVEVGLFNPQHRQVDDRDFFLRLTRGGRVIFTTGVSTRYRVHSESMSLGWGNRLPLARGRFELVREIATGADTAVLRQDEREALRKALRKEADRYLSEATWAGLREYGSAVRAVCAAGEWMVPVKPRALLRALTQVVRRPRAGR